MFRNIAAFIRDHAPKFQVLITAVGTTITAATIAGLAALGQVTAAFALAVWAAFCLIVGLTVAGRAEGLIPA